jgi:predicted Ser/Thr protein kinase
MSPRLSFQLGEDEQAVMACVDTFEQSARETEADLRKYLGTVPEKLRSIALAELVRVDFERRWKVGELRRIVQYLDEYPELRKSGALAELLQAEFDFRRRAGQNPDVAEYRAIEPSFTPPLDTNPHQDTAPLPPAPARLAVEPTRPERIGRYKIVRELGKGGFGIVYLARDETLQRDVAIKVRRGTRSKPGLSADQLHDARAVSKLNDPGIVRVYDADQTAEGVGYVVYEYVEGETLEARIERGGYSHEEAAQWVERVAKALHYAHKNDIVHRDIKPANIIIDGDGQPRLLDFGLARRDGKFFVDERGQLVGTAAYMSPEQASYDPQFATPQSDIYSLGVVLYELLTGKRPFQAKLLDDLLDEIKRRVPAAPRSVDDTIPPALEDICLKAMAKKPEERFRTGADMAAAIRRALRPKWVRYAALAVGAAAASVMIATAFWPDPVPQPAAVTRPTVIGFDIDTNGGSVRHLDRALTSADELEVDAEFSPPAYAYLLKFEQDGGGELLDPAPDKLAEQQKRDALTFPGSRFDYSLDNDADGATFMVVMLSETALTQADLDKILATKMDLGVPPEKMAAHEEHVWVFKEGSDKVEYDRPKTRGKRPAKEKDLERPQALLDRLGNVYCGFLMTHEKASPKKDETP